MFWLYVILFFVMFGISIHSFLMGDEFRTLFATGLAVKNAAFIVLRYGDLGKSPKEAKNVSKNY